MLHSRENPATETFGDGAEGWHAGGAAGKDSTINQDVEVVQRLENIPVELPEIDRRHVTVVDTGSPCGKVVHQDGNLARAPGQVIEGGARTIRVPTPEDLAEVLRNLKPTEYIIPDFIPGTERFVLVTQKNYFALFGNMSGKPARAHEMTDAGRSKLKNGAGLEQVVVAAMTKNAGWTFGAWRVLDRDVDDYTPQPWRDLSVEQWLEILDQTLLPGVLAAPRVFMPSSKSRVGLQTANGHVWILCEGVEDTDALRTRVPAWAAARAAEAAAPLLWSKPRCSRQSDEVIGHATVTLFDHMVWTLHRQIYAGPPTVPAGLPPEIAQKRALRPAEVTAVSPETRRPLDLHKALPPLSERERVRYAETIRSEVRLGADGRVRLENHELLTLDTEVEIQHRGQPRTLTVAEFLEDGEIEFSDRDAGDQGKVRCQAIFRASDSWNGILRKYPDGRVMHHDNGSGITYWMRPSVGGGDFEDATGGYSGGDAGEDAVASTPKTLDDFLARFVYVSESDMVFDLAASNAALAALPRTNFSTTHAGATVVGKSEKPIPLASLWIKDPRRLTVRGLRYAPDRPPGIFADYGEKWVNIFSRPEWGTAQDPDPGAVAVFRRHISQVVDGEREQDLVVDWFAHLLQYPGQRQRFVLLMLARHQGTGRGWLVELSRRLLGIENVKSFSMKEFDSDFDDAFVECLLNVVEEVRETGKERYSFGDTLKDRITAQSKMANRKYGTKREERLYSSFLMQSNHPDAIVLNDTDRRIFVVGTENEPAPDSYFLDLYGHLEDTEFLRSVASFLLRRDLSEYRKILRAPATPAKEAMREATKSPADVVVEMFLEECPAEYFTAAQVERYGRNLAEKGVLPGHASAAAVGAVLAQKAKRPVGLPTSGNVKIDGTPQRPWQRVSHRRPSGVDVQTDCRKGWFRTEAWLGEIDPARGFCEERSWPG